MSTIHSQSRKLRLRGGPFDGRLAEDHGETPAPAPMLLPFDQEGRAVYSTGRGRNRRISRWVIAGPVEPFDAKGAPHAVACYMSANRTDAEGVPEYAFTHLSGFGL